MLLRARRGAAAGAIKVGERLNLGGGISQGLRKEKDNNKNKGKVTSKVEEGRAGNKQQGFLFLFIK